MDLSDFDSSLLVWDEDVAEKAMMKSGNAFIAPAQEIGDGSADTIEQVTLALLNSDSSNNSNLMPLLNNFVSAMADQSMASVALGTSGEGSFHYPLYGSNAPLLSPPIQPCFPLTNQATFEPDAKSDFSLPLQPLTLEPAQISGANVQKLPQHLMINQNSTVKDGYNIHATTDAAGRTHLQPIFPPNFFLPPGTLPWDPSLRGSSPKTTFSVTDRTAALYHSSIQSQNLGHSTHPSSMTQFMATGDHRHTLHNQLFSSKIDNPSLIESNLLQTHDVFHAPPSELRSNFLEAQRLIQGESNGTFYEQSVNPAGQTRPKHTRKNTSVRNEREQRRAAQITELIDELRESMVKAGWKVEMKGKYHTLSRCAEYLQHLKKVANDKEDAIERAKRDLSIRRQKIDEDKALLESRSDPESVISSLTASSCEDHQDLSVRQRENDNTLENQYASKKISSESESNHNGSASSHSELHTNQGRPNVTIENMCSSISDITDKSMKSSMNDPSPSQYDVATYSKSAAVDHELCSFHSSVENASSSSISSTAAVVSGVGSNDRQGRHVDVMVHHATKSSDQRLKRRASTEISSQHKNFVLDYEEVFRTSNVPQLIAALSGRVIACNEFFLKCMGLQTICNLTLFSFVHPDKLADLFELIAKQLRNNNCQVHDATNEGCKYESITLPCAKRPSFKNLVDDNLYLDTPMFMHVTLLGDSDPRKRCFHCILTDIAGTQGKIGYVSIDMLSRMFNKK